MLQSLLTSLSSLQNFFSKSFFLAAFLPTAVFVSLNALILFVWSWPAHNWIQTELLNSFSANLTLTFTAAFLCLWIWSYLTAALTPLWIRTLEGSNWWRTFKDAGRKHHTDRYDIISKHIDETVKIYADINSDQLSWAQNIDAVKKQVQTKQVMPTCPGKPPAATQKIIIDLKHSKSTNQLIGSAQINELFRTCEADIRKTGFTDAIEECLDEMELLVSYAKTRAEREELRLINELNSEFGDREEIAPTRFGNIGLLAGTFTKRAFACNLALIWSPLRRAAEKDENTGKAIESCKTQLDFFVACFWISLALAVQWAFIFAWSGEWIGAIASAIVGPLICWLLWYGAAVEQYRMLQGLIISSMNGPLRFQVITDLRLSLPTDIAEERHLWRTIDLVVGNGGEDNLRYQPSQPTKP